MRRNTFLANNWFGCFAGAPVAGSRATEYYLAPGLQYAAGPRFVIEGSFQFPVVRNTGHFCCELTETFCLA
jgi:hypothetical protein